MHSLSTKYSLGVSAVGKQLFISALASRYAGYVSLFREGSILGLQSLDRGSSSSPRSLNSFFAAGARSISLLRARLNTASSSRRLYTRERSLASAGVYDLLFSALDLGHFASVAFQLLGQGAAFLSRPRLCARVRQSIMCRSL